MEFCENNEFEDPFKERHILLLPEVVLKKVFSYISYNEVASLRIVCNRFNEIGKQILNNGFILGVKFWAQCVKEVKSQLPHRESKRSKHPLMPYSFILSAIDARLSLLSITYFKYIDLHMCCFIPGKVIDEIFKILSYIQACMPYQKSLRSLEVMTELRDISSMAMEHFEEKIEPSFKFALNLNANSQRVFTPISKSVTTLCFGDSQITSEHALQLKVSIKYNALMIMDLRKENLEMKKKYSETCRKVNDQNKIISELSVKVTNRENKIKEVNRRLLEYEQRFADIFSEFSKLKDKTLNNDRSENHELVGCVSPAFLSIGSHTSSTSSAKDFTCPVTYSPCNPNILINDILEHSPSDVLSGATDKLMKVGIIIDDSKTRPTVKRKLLCDLSAEEEHIRKGLLHDGIEERHLLVTSTMPELLRKQWPVIEFLVLRRLCANHD